MKAVVAILSLVTLSSAASLINYNDALNSGQYKPDNTGQYQDNDGRYHPDNSGQYNADGSGAYSGSYEKYKHQLDQFGNGDGGAGGNGGNGGNGGAGSNNFLSGIGRRPSGLGSSRLPGAGGSAHSGLIVSRPSGLSAAILGSGIVAGSGFGVPVELKHGSAAGFYDNRNYAIIRKVETVEEDGYHYLYETENGITGEEQGKVANKGTDNEVMKASGFFTYTGPDNIVYNVEYTSDENGFVPRGAHIPTPPPIPAAILRSLEYQKSVGKL